LYGVERDGEGKERGGKELNRTRTTAYLDTTVTNRMYYSTFSIDDTFQP
jgi:hypothetical protein